MIAYLGLGSNVGDRMKHLHQAVDLLDAHIHLRVHRVSPVYLTAPVGKTDQEWFLNAAAAVETTLPPEALLELVKTIEVIVGRSPSEHWGPREIDIDILACESHRCKSDELTIPHPYLRERAFALRPLCDLAPRLVLGDDNATPAQCLAHLHEPQAVEPWFAPPLHPRSGEWIDLASLSPSETEAIGEAIARECAGQEIIALCGELGTGKTCLARGLARGLGIRQPIQSPTFTLGRSYEGPTFHLHHWDFYRLGRTEEVDSTGFFDVIEEPHSIVAVEWAEKFPALWDFPIIRVQLHVTGEESRRIALRYPLAVPASLKALAAPARLDTTPPGDPQTSSPSSRTS